MSITTENVTNTTETTNFVETTEATIVADVSAKVMNTSVLSGIKKKKRTYNSRSRSEKVAFLQEIVDTFDRVVVTRQELKSLVDPYSGRPWNSFAFIFNATECYVTGAENTTGQKRGVYNLERIAKVPFKRKG